ncbi:hypothetical protein PRK78_007041 [Emydomyces testavorans]|uniref:Uncharacterized protein n=1 Tax=Emydomyces testavorans TaxID=2070801 RepID=A0AAF0DQL4_9EURO|nr:hypothetical protein PRK78_007041 [Emydomyces testavorans]
MDPIITSISQVFSQPVPTVEVKESDYRTVTSTATSTALMDPIFALWNGDRKSLLDLAKWALNSASKSKHVHLPMPQLEDTHRLDKEADIVRLSALQLIHPVNVVVTALMPAGITLRCLSEASSQGNLARTDLKWLWETEEASSVVAVLEYKNTNVIRFSDWKPAIVTPESASEAMFKFWKEKSDTLLKENGILLSKQITKYKTECSDIALFDWEKMIIFDFGDVNEDARNPRLPKVVLEDKTLHFRYLLLGMIVRGLGRAGIINIPY